MILRFIYLFFYDILGKSLYMFHGTNSGFLCFVSNHSFWLWYFNPLQKHHRGLYLILFYRYQNNIKCSNVFTFFAAKCILLFFFSQIFLDIFLYFLIYLSTLYLSGIQVTSIFFLLTSLGRVT